MRTKPLPSPPALPGNPLRTPAPAGSRARYIQHTNEQSFAAPLAFRNTSLFGFFLESCVRCQQRVLDRFLNEPAEGRFDYRAFFPSIFIYFSHFGAGGSVAQPDVNRGVISYSEMGIWIPAAFVEKTSRGVDVATRLSLFPLYTFVDSSIALVTGREVYAFPKEFATLDVPSCGPAPFRVSPTVFERFRPETLAQEQLLLQLVPQASGWSSALAQVFTDTASAIQGVGQLLLGGPRLTLPGPELGFSVLETFLRGPTFTFLKQFRSASNPDEACYQAIIEAPTQARFHRLALLPEDYALTIQHCASHPLVRQLGLVPETFSQVRGFRLDMDMAFGPGQELWRAE